MVIGSWAPFEPTSALVMLFAALQVALPELALTAPALPLGDPVAMHDELDSAGFRGVHVEQVTHDFHATDVNDQCRRAGMAACPDSHVEPLKRERQCHGHVVAADAGPAGAAVRADAR